MAIPDGDILQEIAEAMTTTAGTIWRNYATPPFGGEVTEDLLR